MKKIIIKTILPSICLSSVQAQPKVVGTWERNFGRYQETTTYAADGSYQSMVEFVRGPAHEPTVIKGTWKIQGNTLIVLTKAGVARDQIVFKDDDTFEISEPGLETMTYTRVNPQPEKVAKPMPNQIRLPKVGDPERKIIVDTMRGPVSKYAGVEVIFTGDLEILGDWAKFTGNVKPKRGKFPEDRVDEVELDFLAILTKKDGKWTQGYFGWSGDIGTLIEARAKHPGLPKELVPVAQ